MAKLSRRIAAVLLWFVVFYIIDRFLITDTSFDRLMPAVYVIAALLALGALSPYVRRLPSVLLNVIALIVYGILLLSNQVPMMDELHIFIAVNGLLMLLVMAHLSKQLGDSLQEFHDAVETLTFAQDQQNFLSAKDVKEHIETCIYTSRRWQHPLSLIILQTNIAATETATPTLVEDVQRTMLQSYTKVMIARVLKYYMRRSDVIGDAPTSGRLVLVSPGTSAEEGRKMARRMTRVVQEQLGLEVKCSTATFPQDGLTLDGLFQSADQHFVQALPERAPSPLEINIHA